MYRTATAYICMFIWAVSWTIPATAQDAVPAPVPAAPGMTITSLPSLITSSLAALREKAEQDDAAANLALARALFADLDPAKQAEGLPYAERASELGAVQAQLLVGNIYRQGSYGIVPDIEKAKAAYQQAIDSGSTEALAAMGTLVVDTNFTTAGRQEGIDLLKQAVDAGQISAANSLGLLYVQGRGVQRSLDTALQFYGMGLVAGDTSAIVAVGDLLRTGAPELDPSPSVALEFYQRASIAGDRGATRRIADMTLRGEVGPADLDEALRMLNELAAQGDVSSYLALGDIYARGEFTPSDGEKARQYYALAAANANPAGLTRLGDIYLTGVRGLSANAQLAMQNYEQAAALGNSAARRALANIYLDGVVAPPNPQLAITLLSEAAGSGDGQAAEQIGLLYAANDPFPANYEQVKTYLDLTLAVGNTRGALRIASAMATGPLRRGHADEALEILTQASESGTPGAAAELAKLQLAGTFPARGIEGVINTLYAASEQGDIESARYLLQLYRDGSGLLLPPDAEAALTFLDRMQPIFGAEITAMERITIAASQGEDQDILEDIDAEFSKLNKPNGMQVLNQLRQINARAYVYLLQVRMIEHGLYSGALTGSLDGPTIRAIGAVCAAAEAERQCAPGPLTQQASNVLGQFLLEPGKAAQKSPTPA